VTPAATLEEQRAALRPTLSLSDAGDALAVYYALYHDPKRTQLTLHHDADGRVYGFVAVCRTGQDLFRPLVTLRARSRPVLTELLPPVLRPGWPYACVVPAELAVAVNATVTVRNASLNLVYVLDANRFQPVINVLVQQARGANGSPRAVIRSGERIVAEAGLNWRSPYFAEVYVHTDPAVRGRGYGRSVVSALTALLVEEGIRPLYVVPEGHNESIQLAQGLGYMDSGAREYQCEISLPAGLIGEEP
jgi:hypothetical protein